MKKILTVVLAAATLTAGAVTTNVERNRAEQAQAWADSVYTTLSPRQRIAQLMVPWLMPGQNGTRESARKLMGDYGCGGMILQRGTVEATADAIRYGEEFATVPPLVTLDGEWGLSMRVQDTPRFPHNVALGAIRNTRLLYDYGREVARECRLMGFDVDYAPVADVNSNPNNPVIGYRAFGEDPERVAKATVAYSLGLEDGGVQAVAKHFPGHGDTDADSHKELPTVHHSKRMLDSTDLVPFRSFIDAGCSGIMVGHLAVPSLDKSGRPASMSPKISTGLLRNQLGFEGLVYTDALGMKGALMKGKNAAVTALEAGADMLVAVPDVKEALDAIEKAIEKGKIKESTIEERCKRVLRYKYLFNCADTVVPDNAQLKKAVNPPEAEALIKKLASASITVLRNRGGILPVGKLAEKKIVAVNIGAPEHNDFTKVCRHYADVQLFSTNGALLPAAAINAVRGADVVIAAAYNDNASSRAVMQQLSGATENLVGVFLVNPYKMQKFHASIKDMAAIVLAYDDIPAERVSAAEAIFGGINVDGVLPVNLEGIAPAGTSVKLLKTRLGFSSPVAEGMAPWLTDSIDSLVNVGLSSGAFPGCQVLVARNGNIVIDRQYGHLAMGGGAKVSPQTVYDLASVSKATGTLPGIMKAYDMGLLKLDAKLSALIPEITDSAKKEITVRELLYHESGMPPALNMFKVMIDSNTFTGKMITPRPDADHKIKIQNKAYGHNNARLRTDIVSRHRSEAFPVEASRGLFTGQAAYDTIMGRIYDIPLRDTKDYTYSCLNFCLLMNIEQRLTGRSHDEFVGSEIFAPLGAYRTGYRPTQWSNIVDIAPTEHDTFLRRQTLRGFVHDETANFSGGVQGNAGLFANAGDLAKICQMWLNGGTYGGQRVLSAETVRLFTTDKSPTCRRGLGFDKPDTENPDYSPTCDEARASVYGHLGFTGTVFWVDPEENLIFIFLTNRVNPTRDNAAFSKLNIRPRLFSYVYRSLAND